jgi:hypothetical protein
LYVGLLSEYGAGTSTLRSQRTELGRLRRRTAEIAELTFAVQHQLEQRRGRSGAVQHAKQLDWLLKQTKQLSDKFDKRSTKVDAQGRVQVPPHMYDRFIASIPPPAPAAGGGSGGDTAATAARNVALLSADGGGDHTWSMQEEDLSVKETPATRAQAKQTLAWCYATQKRYKISPDVDWGKASAPVRQQWATKRCNILMINAQ